MRYKRIRRGCKLYHDSPYAYDEAYNEYMESKDRSKWDNPETLDLIDAKNVITFINRWRTRSPMRPSHLLPVLKEQMPHLNTLRNKTILDIEFDETTKELIQTSFDAIERCGPRHETVGTSKILHTINPELFVMWDTAIMIGYGIHGTGRGYTNQFLPQIQELAVTAINEIVDRESISHSDAVSMLAPRSHTIAKIMDEYNYARFTRGAG